MRTPAQCVMMYSGCGEVAVSVAGFCWIVWLVLSSAPAKRSMTDQLENFGRPQLWTLAEDRSRGHRASFLLITLAMHYCSSHQRISADFVCAHLCTGRRLFSTSLSRGAHAASPCMAFLARAGCSLTVSPSLSISGLVMSTASTCTTQLPLEARTSPTALPKGLGFENRFGLGSLMVRTQQALKDQLFRSCLRLTG